jgi:CRP-like cAMP-binding protein
MSTPGDDRAFPVLSPSQLAEMASFGSEMPVASGDLLFEAGDASFDLFVVLEGEVEVVRSNDEDDDIVAAFDRVASSAS